MSQGPSTLGIMTTASLSPISPTRCITSSRNQGLSRLFTRVHSWQSAKSSSRPSLARPSRAAILRSAAMASSRLPSSTSHFLASSGTFVAIFGLLASKKWIMREGSTGISRTGSGAPAARGLKKSLALRMGSALLVELDDADRAGRRGLAAQVAEHALVEVLLDDAEPAAVLREDVHRADLHELPPQRGVPPHLLLHPHVH